MPRTGRSAMLFELLSACTLEGCPVCRLTSQSAARFFDSLTYENTNDPTIRAELRASRGFCNRHTWQYATYRDGLGTAIVYRDVLRDVLREVEAAVEPGELLARAAGQLLRQTSSHARDHILRALEPGRPCIVCMKEATTSRDALDALLRRLPEPDVATSLSGSSGLCRQHLAHALTMIRTPDQRAMLVRAQHSAWSRLRERTAAGETRAAAAALAARP